MSTSLRSGQDTGFEIAIVGMAGRFPGAKSIEQFWQMIRNGVEAMTFFTDEELKASGIDPSVYNSPNYVKAGRVLEGVEFFDATFFGYTPREAALMDPQQRIFLENAWHALEDAGYDPERYASAIGVYAGVGMNTYFINNLLSNPDIIGSARGMATWMGNDNDYVAMRVSYKLNLRGPAFTVATACSTSLVATHLACQGLLNNECDMALAGGVLALAPQKAGYMYVEGGIYSPDGHCRAFDADAEGTVGGNGGVGVIVLKRLQDAIAANDRIVALIKASAINNDGSDKIGFTAPSVNGQAQVIAEALAMAEVEPETVGYIESHGTGTRLGDPIEIAALTQAFRARTDKKVFCAIGSVKTNVGHLDAAAGVTGLIKTVLALQHKEIPPSRHFEKPNREIDFENSPFFVNNKLLPWQAGASPRRAGVSSFGIGGTNAHIVLEEAPLSRPASESRERQLLLLSAKTAGALETMTENLAEHFEKHPEIDLADTAYTLQTGRGQFTHRRMLVCENAEDAISALRSKDAKRLLTRSQSGSENRVAFMFPGQGAQYVSMGSELYRNESFFREQVDRCCALLKPHLGFDLLEVIYPKSEEADNAADRLKQTFCTQPALFVIEYAMAQLWMSWGVKPQAMIGHSIGEYVAACLAGVFSLQDALALVAARGRMMQDLPTGAMLAVPLPAEEIEALPDDKISIAAVNEPSGCVVSGTFEAIEAFTARMSAKGTECRRLHTSHAFHSAMMDEILTAFTERVSQVTRNKPEIPYISNVTGTWITAEEATDAGYYARHLRQTVHFAAGVETLVQEPKRLLLEVGPARTLSTLAAMTVNRMQDRQNGSYAAQVAVPSMRHPNSDESDLAFLLTALGKVWLAGVEVDWAGFYTDEKRRRVSLPAYPFERQRHWIEAKKNRGFVARRSLQKISEIADWFYLPAWQRADLISELGVGSGESSAESGEKEALQWLFFDDGGGLGEKLMERLLRVGHSVVSVTIAEKFEKSSATEFAIDPKSPGDYESLFGALADSGALPDRIVHLWGVTPVDGKSSETPHAARCTPQLEYGFNSLLFLAKALGKQLFENDVRITIVTSTIHEVTGEETLAPEKAAVLGPCQVIPQEYPGMKCKNIDLVQPASGAWQANRVDQLVAELMSEASEMMIAYRGKHRWVQKFQPVRLAEKTSESTHLREGGVYLITGGLGGIGLTLAQYLAETVHAKLILAGRSGLPEREQWADWLSAHGEQDTVSRKIRKVQAMEKAGAEVSVVSADVADEVQMQAAIEQTFSKFGALHGVFHAAGCLAQETFLPISEIGEKECVQQFQPKVQGLYVLAKVLHGRELDFCVLMSSISAMLGGVGFVAYAAANIFMDAFVHAYNKTGRTHWMSVNWDSWMTEKEAAQAGQNGRAAQTVMSGEAGLMMAPEEGIEAFRRILSVASVDRIVVSVGDLQARLDRWINPEAFQEAEQQQVHSDDLETLQARPELQSSYLAPHNDDEKTIASIWGKIIGIEKIGVNDNFFDLGGHSLLAIQIISRLREAFRVELPINLLFDAPTIAELTAHIESLRKPKTAKEDEKMKRLLDLVEGAADDEIEALLAESEEAGK